jgi:hypothetical protein
MGAAALACHRTTQANLKLRHRVVHQAQASNNTSLFVKAKPKSLLLNLILRQIPRPGFEYIC